MRFIFLIDKVISSAFLYIMSATPTIILIMINIIEKQLPFVVELKGVLSFLYSI